MKVVDYWPYSPPEAGLGGSVSALSRHHASAHLPLCANLDPHAANALCMEQHREPICCFNT